MSPSVQEAYVILGIPYGSNEETARKAYRRLVSAWHPDRNGSPDAHNQTLKINAAIRALEAVNFSVDTVSIDRTFHFSDHFGADFDEEVYGFNNTRSREYQNAFKSARPISRKVKLTIEQAAFGSIHSLRGKATDVCRPCNGSGRSDERVTCPGCHGHGRVDTMRSWTGRQCVRCNGYGYLMKSCSVCKGSGRGASRAYEFKVNIPPGARNGNVLVARGVGAFGSDGKTRGEARIEIVLLHHEFFSFDDDGILTITYPVLLTELLRHETVMVPTLYGPQPVKLNPHRPVYKLDGFGFPDRRGEPGPLTVRLRIAIPALDDPALEYMWRDIESQLLRRRDPDFEANRKERDALLLYKPHSVSAAPEGPDDE